MNVIILRLFIRGLGKRRPLILRISLKLIDWHVEKCQIISLWGNDSPGPFAVTLF